MKTHNLFALSLLAVTLGIMPLAADEPTVAEQAERIAIAQIKKNFEETLKAVPTRVTGLAMLPDGTPAVGFKIGGWGRSITNVGYGHFLLGVTLKLRKNSANRQD